MGTQYRVWIGVEAVPERGEPSMVDVSDCAITHVDEANGRALVGAFYTEDAAQTFAQKLHDAPGKPCFECSNSSVAKAVRIAGLQGRIAELKAINSDLRHGIRCRDERSTR